MAAAVSGGRGALAEANCETDFAARHPDFLALVMAAAEAALESPAPVPVGGEVAASGADAAAGVAATVRENVVLRRAARLDAPPGGLLGHYVHAPAAPGAGRMAAVVAVAPRAAGAALEHAAAAAFARSLAMHVVAARPLALDVASLPAAAVAAETEVARARAAATGKPAAVVDRIAAGRLAKWHEEVVLLKQRLVTDEGGATVEAAAKSAGVAVAGFLRLQVGEGVEKATGGDFAAEVAATLKQAGGA